MTESNRMLLVEDDETFGRVISRAMQQRGYEVQHAESADSATNLLNHNLFDLAVLDLNLGGHSSLPLIPILKGTNPEMRILVLTGYASIATAVDAIKLGADNYLAKPADADEILAALLGDPLSRQEDEQAIQEPMSVRRLEWEHIQKVLKENDGNISETARQLKMHRRTLQRKLQKRPVAR
ncbi:MAG: response regulator transcription factor [Pseudomonadales bacterium]|nr:response regulator transcription factor [Pseudomonadales bacterium]MCP5356584.1 response regulator transcription factor [Pseudomonadales bacterium]